MKSNKGFTLIELLVVIAIIGILSSVVLASLGTARNRGADAAIKSGLVSIRNQAEIYASTTTGYTNLCTSTEVANMLTSVRGNNTVAGCGSTATTWVVSALLKNAEGVNGHWCVDSNGASKAVNTGGTSTGACI